MVDSTACGRYNLPFLRYGWRQCDHGRTSKSLGLALVELRRLLASSNDRVKQLVDRVSLLRSVMIGEALRICKAIESGDKKTTEASLGTWASIPADLLNLSSALGTGTEYLAALQFVFQKPISLAAG